MSESGLLSSSLKHKPVNINDQGLNEIKLSVLKLLTSHHSIPVA